MRTAPHGRPPVESRPPHAPPLDDTDRTLLVTGAAVAAPGTSVRAEALAVRGGRVVHVGTAEDARAALGGRADDVLDLDGGLVHPGFVDAHCHPVMYGQALAWVDCRPERVPDIETLVAVLTDAARELPAGVPVRGFGYEHPCGSPSAATPPATTWTASPPTARCT